MLNKLKKGDIVEIIAPSSFIENEEYFNEGIEILKRWDLNIKQNNLLSKKYKYFAGDDEYRFQSIVKAQSSKLIIFAKGGWGAARILEKTPNWGGGLMLGFSDTCSLLLSKYAHGSYGSIHGPMLTTLSREPEWSLERLRKLLFEGFVDDIQGIPLKGGVAEGEIIVSNLTIASFLLGTDHLPSLKGKILIFEDINEDIYKIDRMLTFWRMSKNLIGIAGIGFGNFSNCIDKNENNDLLKELIIERLEEFNFPIVYNLPIGHLSGNACIPIGYKAKLNGNNGVISFKLPHG